MPYRYLETNVKTKHISWKHEFLCCVLHDTVNASKIWNSKTEADTKFQIYGDTMLCGIIANIIIGDCEYKALMNSIKFCTNIFCCLEALVECRIFCLLCEAAEISRFHECNIFLGTRYTSVIVHNQLLQYSILFTCPV